MPRTFHQSWPVIDIDQVLAGLFQHSYSLYFLCFCLVSANLMLPTSSLADAASLWHNFVIHKNHRAAVYSVVQAGEECREVSDSEFAKWCREWWRTKIIDGANFSFLADIWQTLS